MLPIDSELQRSRRTEPARFCFRYRRHRRHANAYDVFIELGGPGHVCRIEIHHANGLAEERQPFTSGALSARRLGSAVALLGLVDRVARKDRSRMIPGGLVFSARLKQPYVLRPSVATRLHTRTTEERHRKKGVSSAPPDTEPLSRRAAESNGKLRCIHDSPRARARHRYPLRGI